jgi:hypothetical protein
MNTLVSSKKNLRNALFCAMLVDELVYVIRNDIWGTILSWELILA